MMEELISPTEAKAAMQSLALTDRKALPRQGRRDKRKRRWYWNAGCRVTERSWNHMTGMSDKSWGHTEDGAPAEGAAYGRQKETPRTVLLFYSPISCQCFLCSTQLEPSWQSSLRKAPVGSAPLWHGAKQRKDPEWIWEQTDLGQHMFQYLNCIC